MGLPQDFIDEFKDAPYVRQISGIRFLIENPCDIPWMVYFETLAPAVGRGLVVIFLEFGTDDVIRGFTRPRGVNKGRGRPKRGRRKGRRAWRGIPEIGNLIGSKLPGANTVRARGVTDGVKNLWRLDSAIQRVFFWWMVADVIEEGLFQWQTALIQTQQCKDALRPRAAMTGSPGTSSAISGWVGQIYGTTLYAIDISASLGEFGIPAGVTAFISFSMVALNVSAVGQDQQAAIFLSGENDPVVLGGKKFVEPGEEGHHLVSITVKGPRGVASALKLSNGFSDGQRGDAFAFALN